MSTSGIMYEDPGVIVALYKNLIVGAWSKMATAEHARALHKAFMTCLKMHPTGVATAIIVTAETPVMSFSKEARAALTELTKETGDYGLGTAFFEFHGGVVGTTLRTIMTCMFLAARSKEPQKVFGNYTDGARWLLRCLSRSEDASWSSQELVELLERLGRQKGSPTGSSSAASTTSTPAN